MKPGKRTSWGCAGVLVGVVVIGLLAALIAGPERILELLTGDASDASAVDQAPATSEPSAPSATGAVIYEGSQFSDGSLDDITGEFTAPAGCDSAILTYTGRSAAGGAARVTWRLRNTTGTAPAVTVGPVDIPPQSGVEWLPLTPGHSYRLDVHTFGVTVAYSVTCE